MVGFSKSINPWMISNLAFFFLLKLTQHFGMTAGVTASATLRMHVCVVSLMLIILRCEMLTSFVSAMNTTHFSEDGFDSAQCVTPSTNMLRTCDAPRCVVTCVSHICESCRTVFIILCFDVTRSKLFTLSFVNVIQVVLEMLDTLVADL